MMPAWTAVPTGEQTLAAVCDTLEDAVYSLRHLQETESRAAPALLLVGVAPGTRVPEGIDGVQVIAVSAIEVALANGAARVLAPLHMRGLDGPALRLYLAYLTAERVVLLVSAPDRASAHAWSEALALTNAYDIRTYPLRRSPPGQGAERALPGAAIAVPGRAAPTTAGDVSALTLGGPSVIGGAGPAPTADGGADVLCLWRSGGELARSATGEGVTALATRPEP